MSDGSTHFYKPFLTLMIVSKEIKILLKMREYEQIVFRRLLLSDVSHACSQNGQNEGNLPF